MPTKQQTINQINSERDRIDKFAIKEIRKSLRQIRIKILSAIKHNQSIKDAINSQNEDIQTTLINTMILAHLTGTERSQAILKQKGVETTKTNLNRSNGLRTIYLSVLTNAIKAITKRTNIDQNTLPRLTDLYKPKVLDDLALTQSHIEKTLQRALQESIAQGDHVQASIGRMRNAMDSQGLGFDNPFVYETIIRTETQLAYSVGQQAVYNDPSVQSIIWGFQFSSIGDSRTTDICNPLDNLQAPKNDPIWERITPPNHFNCRSTLIPIFKDEQPEQRDTLPNDWVADSRFDFNPASVFRN